MQNLAHVSKIRKRRAKKGLLVGFGGVWLVFAGFSWSFVGISFVFFKCFFVVFDGHSWYYFKGFGGFVKCFDRLSFFRVLRDAASRRPSTIDRPFAR